MALEILNIQNLSKTFSSENGQRIHVLDDISLSAHENDFVCIVGPSGCGKSTLLKIIAGLDQDYEGTVLHLDRPVRTPHPKIGLVFQEYSLLPWRTVRENIALGPEFAGASRRDRNEIASEYLTLIGLEKFGTAYPHELSGGMQQRVAIARALANNPDLLLMDEPFGALDAHTRILMQRELLRIRDRHRKTILFVTHSVDEAVYLADRIHVLSAHPARIRATIDVPMPMPRDRSYPAFGKLTDDILTLLDSSSDLNACFETPMEVVD